jgi:alpha-L-rhamnosidase
LLEGEAGANSKVHSGGCGVAWILSKYVLGVQPLTPGYGRCRIEPGLGDLQWARGAVPTVRGEIGIDWRRSGPQVVLEVSLPEGLDTELAVPWDGGENLEIAHNGVIRQLKPNAPTPDGIALLGGSAVINVIGGRHQLAWKPV